MGARGPAPKSPETRQRERKGATLKTNLAVLPSRPVIEPPEDLSERGKAEWTAFLGSETGRVADENSLPALRRLFSMRDRLERFERMADDEPWIVGSTKQAKLSPLFGEIANLRKDILAIEDRFGMNPRQKAALGVAFGDAAKSLDELNERYAKRQTDEPSDATSLDLATR